jgi:hypothetical protein
MKEREGRRENGSTIERLEPDQTPREGKEQKEKRKRERKDDMGERRKGREKRGYSQVPYHA